MTGQPTLFDIPAVCSVDGCEGVSHARGWCPKHYKRWKRHGDPLTKMTMSGVDPRKRCLNQFTVGDHCWIWTGVLGGGGYGRLKVDGRYLMSHRFVYEWFVGPIPEDLVLDHLCRTPRCVRPDHLEPVTSGENTRRGLSGAREASRTHCPQGHPYDESNTSPRPHGWRACRACARIRMARLRAIEQWHDRTTAAL